MDHKFLSFSPREPQSRLYSEKSVYTIYHFNLFFIEYTVRRDYNRKFLLVNLYRKFCATQNQIFCVESKICLWPKFFCL